MKCNGSPTTSIVPDRAARPSIERAVVANFEALVFRQAFAPLAKAIGFYGDTVVDAAAQAMARAREDAS